MGPVGKLFGVSIPNPHLWSPADPFLYDVIVSLTSTPPLPLQSTAFLATSGLVGFAMSPVAWIMTRMLPSINAVVTLAMCTMCSFSRHCLSADAKVTV